MDRRGFGGVAAALMMGVQGLFGGPLHFAGERLFVAPDLRPETQHRSPGGRARRNWRRRRAAGRG